MKVRWLEGHKPPPDHVRTGYTVTVPTMTVDLRWRVVAVDHVTMTATLRTQVMESVQEMTVPWDLTEYARWAA